MSVDILIAQPPPIDQSPRTTFTMASSLSVTTDHAGVDFDGIFSSFVIARKQRFEQCNDPMTSTKAHKARDSVISLKIPPTLLVERLSEIECQKIEAEVVDMAHQIMNSPCERYSFDSPTYRDGEASTLSSYTPLAEAPFSTVSTSKRDIRSLNRALSELTLPLCQGSDEMIVHPNKDSDAAAAPVNASKLETIGVNHSERCDTIPSSIFVPVCMSLVAKNRKRKRSVRFETARPLVHPTLSVADMTIEEIRSAWLQEDEFAKIHQRDEFLAFQAEHERNLLPTPVPSTYTAMCTRGLERKMTLETLQAQARRLCCLEQVLVEQDEQWDYQAACVDIGGSVPEYDDEAIAAVSREVTEESRSHALQVGLNDRQEVEKLWQDDA